MGNARHVASDVLAAIVDTGVLQTEECSFDELPCAEIHHACVLRRNSELKKVEMIQAFQECAGVGEDPSSR